MIDLTSIKARAEAATPGPWKHEVQTGMIAGWPDEIIAIDRRLDVSVYEGDARIRGGHSASRRNAVFIAHAREDVPALVAEVERLRELLEDVIDRSWEDTVGDNRVLPGDLFERIRQACPVAE